MSLLARLDRGGEALKSVAPRTDNLDKKSLGGVCMPGARYAALLYVLALLAGAATVKLRRSAAPLSKSPWTPARMPQPAQTPRSPGRSPRPPGARPVVIATFTAAATGQIAAVARTPDAPVDGYRLERLRHADMGPNLSLSRSADEQIAISVGRGWKTLLP